MDDNELAFNAWILVGNVLAATLSATPAAGLRPAPSIRERLLSLQTALDPVPPERILTSLAVLPAEDQQLLKSLCIQGYNALGADAATALGLDETAAGSVVDFLGNTDLRSLKTK